MQTHSPSVTEADLLSVTHAAALLKVNRRTLQRWIKTKMVKKEGNKVVVQSALSAAEHYRVYCRRGPRLGSTLKKRTDDERERIAIYRDYHRANRIAKAIARLEYTGLKIVAEAVQKTFRDRQAARQKAAQSESDSQAATGGP